jgi:predicted HicB family RNase H-like nuclease
MTLSYPGKGRDDSMASKPHTTVYLKPALHRRLRLRAIHEGISMTKLIEKAIQEYLDRPVKKRKG